VSYVETSAGGAFGLARRSDGEIASWGKDLYGLGNPPPEPVGAAWVEVAAGRDHAYARRSDGALVSWGSPSLGMLETPALPPGVTWTEVAPGNMHTSGRRSDGRVEAWGFGLYGQTHVPPLPPGTAWVALASGQYHSIAKRSDGALVAWGSGSSAGFAQPPPLAAGERFGAIAAADNVSVAVIEHGPPCGSVSRYCTQRPNAFDPIGARLDASGCIGLTANDLVLSVVGAPPGELALVRWASLQQHVPFAGGFDCLAGTLLTLPAPLAVGAAGTGSLPVDLAQPPLAGVVGAGSTWNVQATYRDGGTVRTSDALHLVFAP
jgi:hypothetical protein